MNNLISFYAWSPSIFAFLSMGWVLFYFSYAKNNPKVLVIIGVCLIVYLAVNLYSSGILIEAANCQRMDAGSAEGCTLLGQDVTSGLYNFMVAPWFGMFAISAGFLFISTGLVLIIGWMPILKAAGYFIVALFALAFLKGLISGVTKHAYSADEKTGMVVALIICALAYYGYTTYKSRHNPDNSNDSETPTLSQ